MSYLKKIEFCKVYFNNHYENVFDNESFFDKAEKYSYIDFDDNTKGFDPNFNAKITLREGVNVTYYNNVNYCRVTMNDDFKLYYFITDYEFTNSGSVITFTLEKDVWHSNLSIINAEEFKSHRQFIERMTYDGFRIDNENFVYDNFLSDESDIIPTKMVNYYEHFSLMKERCLFLKILLDGDFYKGYYPLVGDGIRTVALGEGIQVGNRYILPLTEIYIPFIVVRNNMTLVEWLGAISVPSSEYWGDNDYERRISILQYQVENFLSFTSKFSTHILSMSLCFNVPFSVDYYGDGNLPYFRGEGVSHSFVGFIPKKDTDKSNAIYLQGFMGSSSEQVSYTQEIDKINHKLKVSELPSALSSDINDIRRTIGRCFYYPYEFFSLNASSYKETIIPPYNSKSLTLSNEYVLGSCNVLKEKFNNLNPEKYIPLINRGEIIINRDSLTEYLRASQNQIATDFALGAIKSAIGTVGNLTSQNYAGAAMSLSSFGGSILSVLSKIEDADAAKDNVTIPSINALSDLFYQDDVLINFSYIDDEVKKLGLAWYLHKYGIAFNKMDFPLQQRHQRFDYIKTVNCDLELPLLSDTNQLRDILNNGVRIWHCTSNVAPEFNTFQIKYINLPLSMAQGVATINEVIYDTKDTPIYDKKEEN